MSQVYNHVFLGDCISGMKANLTDKSVDICITSPPYKNEDGYTDELIVRCFQQVYRALKDNSLCFVNFGHLADFKSRPFMVAIWLEAVDFKINDTIIWEKTQFSPVQGKKRLNNVTEFIFMCYKGKMPDLNRLSIGVPYKDKTNVKRYAGGKDLRCGGNLWKFGYETIQSKEEKLHNDRFPVELPERCLKLSGLPQGSLVLDPFFGSGTTGVAARKLGMNYVGFEKQEQHYNTATRRLWQQ